MSEYGEDLRALVRGLAADRAPADLWTALVEAGIPDVGRESGDSSDLSDLGDLAGCVEELAASTTDTPLAEHATAAWALGDDPGELTTVAAYPRFTVAQSMVTGVAEGVPWADRAARMLLVSDDQAVLVSLNGAEITATEGISGRTRSTVTMTELPVTACSAHTPDAIRGRLRTLRAATLIGAASAAFDLTSEYVRTREQFGAPLIKIPAVAQKLAVMRTELILARAAIERAIVGATPGNRISASAREARTRAARVLAGQCATEVAALAHQLHGAMGITAEYPLHRATRLLWAMRDADLPERDEAIALGRASVTIDEAGFWDELTVPDL